MVLKPAPFPPYQPAAFEVVLTIKEHSHSTLKILHSNSCHRNTWNKIEQQQKYLLHVTVLYSSSKTGTVTFNMSACANAGRYLCVHMRNCGEKKKDGKYSSVIRTNEKQRGNGKRAFTMTDNCTTI